MPQYSFGTGQLYGMPVGGGDPLQFGALQDVSIDLSADIKQLYGQYQFPLAVARGKTKIEGKASTGEINPTLYNNLYFGASGTQSTGTQVPIFGEAAVVPAAVASVSSTALTQTGGIATATFAAAHGLQVGQTINVTGATPSGYNVTGARVLSVPSPTTLTYAVPPATVTPATVQGSFTGLASVTVANTPFYLDLRVAYTLTGAKLTQVASSPAKGQYTVSASGVYGFNAADVGAGVLINYLFTDSVNGSTLAITNQLMGVAPTWQLVLAEQFNNQTFVLVLYSCTSSKLSFPFKQDDFSISEMDFQAQANGAGNIGFITASLAAEP